MNSPGCNPLKELTFKKYRFSELNYPKKFVAIIRVLMYGRPYRTFFSTYYFATIRVVPPGLNHFIVKIKSQRDALINRESHHDYTIS